jgi:hypothetical protein
MNSSAEFCGRLGYLLGSATQMAATLFMMTDSFDSEESSLLFLISSFVLFIASLVEFINVTASKRSVIKISDKENNNNNNNQTTPNTEPLIEIEFNSRINYLFQDNEWKIIFWIAFLNLVGGTFYIVASLITLSVNNLDHLCNWLFNSGMIMYSISCMFTLIIAYKRIKNPSTVMKSSPYLLIVGVSFYFIGTILFIIGGVVQELEDDSYVIYWLIGSICLTIASSFAFVKLIILWVNSKKSEDVVSI